MSRCTHYEPCPRCRDNGKDNRGDNLGMYVDGSAHCWSCGYHSFAKHWVPPVKKDDHNVKSLPADFSREIPARAWKWLLQYGLGYSYWKPFVGWSEKDQRLVFTVGTGPEFSIGRWLPPDNQSGNDRQGGDEGGTGPQMRVAVPGTNSKGRIERPETPKQRKWFFYGDGHKTPHVLGDYKESKRVVLVEDIVSAHKVGRATACICLFGTNIFSGCIPVLRHIGLPITIWLDNDQQGTVASKAANLSMLTGLPVGYRFTDQDPKCLNFDQIERTIE